MKVSLLIPVFRPPQHWLETLQQQVEWLGQQPGVTAVELIAVIDGDADVSVPPHLPGNMMVFSHAENEGKGFTLRAAAARATGDVCLYTDVDLPYTTASMGLLLAALTTNQCDIAMGIKDASYYQNLPAFRVAISKGLRWCIQRFLRLPTDDTQCGLKGFNAAGKALFLQTTINRYLFDLEFISRSARAGLRIKPIEVHLRDGVQFHRMSWKVMWQEGWNFLKILLA